MSSVDEDQSSQSSNVVEDGLTLKPAEGHSGKMNGLSEDSASESGDYKGKLKENGLVNHASKNITSSSKSGEGHRHSSSKSSGSDKHHSSSSAKHKEGSSSSSKHGSSSSSSRNRDSHSSSSSSKHKEGSSSQHSSSKHKEGTTSSSSSHREKDKSSSSSSKPRDGTSSSSPNKHSSSGSSKHKESSSSSKHKDSHSSSSRPKEGTSSGRDKSVNSSTDRSTDKNRSSSSDKLKETSKESSHGKKDKLTSSSSKPHTTDKHALTSNGEKQKNHSAPKEEGSNKEKTSVSSPLNNGVTSKLIKEDVDVKMEESKPVLATDLKDLRVSIKKVVVSPPGKSERSSSSPTKQPGIKSEPESEDDDKPLSARKKQTMKRPKEESDYEDEDSDVPLSVRNKAKKLKTEKKLAKKEYSAPPVIKASPMPKKKSAKVKKEAKDETEDEPAKKKKKPEEEVAVWKWWEEQQEDTGVKWNYLEHCGPVFAPEYERLPKTVRFYYDGKPMELTKNTEEVAVYYGRMLDHDYTTRDVFNNNFMKDWRKVMSSAEQTKITDLKKCNFHEILDYFKKKTEERKAMSKEEKQKLKKENEEIVKKYGYCTVDNHKEKIGNFRIEPPGLFRGRGDHPKQGKFKRRIMPEDVIINCSKNSKIPAAPAGHKWKEVRHDNKVTWLASWTESIQGATKYVMLNAASKLKGEKDWQKYETARKLINFVDKIRAQYQVDWKSKEMRRRQCAVAVYFIDKLALRAGNEKDEGETADTVGCCSLRVEHITLHDQKDGKEHVVEFDFLGKDSIRYQNSIPVEKRVFKNLQLFMENKQKEDDLFDRLNTTILNKELADLMPGLTAKVFRTFNASNTLSEQLELLTNPKDSPAAMMLAYNRANRAVAILCNHQRAVPKTFEKSMENLGKKIESKKDEIKQVKKEIKGIKAEYKKEKSVRTKTMYEKKKKQLARLEDQFSKLEVQATDKDENKDIALGTSKLNYLDPRISVAWCKKYNIPLEKVYNKTQRDKFRWAIDMADEHFKFC